MSDERPVSYEEFREEIKILKEDFGRIFPQITSLTVANAERSIQIKHLTEIIESIWNKMVKVAGVLGAVIFLSFGYTTLVHQESKELSEKNENRTYALQNKFNEIENEVIVLPNKIIEIIEDKYNVTVE